MYLTIEDLILLGSFGERADAADSRPSLNELGFEDLQSELGLARTVAAEIVRSRKYHRFESWDDVKEVQGIGPKTISMLMEVASL
jgi:DNA uptake protein ComE-like DNA-binding protein